MHKFNYTENVVNVIKAAEKISQTLGLGYIGSEHLLYGLMSVNNSVAQKYLLSSEYKVDEKRYKEFVYTSRQTDCPVIGFNDESKRILDRTEGISAFVGDNFIATEHVLYSILEDERCTAVRILSGMGVNWRGLKEILRYAFEKAGAKKSEQPAGASTKKSPESQVSFEEAGAERAEKTKGEALKALSAYGVDMTERARLGKYDPVIGRDKEIERMAQILLRRTKNSPIIVGEPGVGKSAVVEGFAMAIVEGRVPDSLLGKTIFSLNLSGMLAGTRYRGDFEERLKNAIDFVVSDGSIILFIDEIHNLIGAGASGEGKFDAADILKPMLARGELTVIGATTYSEYRKYIEKDSAFERRFSQVYVDPPTVEDAVKILFGLRDRYEKHHGVTITDEAVVAACELSDRYVTDRYLPDKAIDLIDEAASKAKIEGVKTGATDVYIGREEVAKVISDWTNIPAAKLSESEAQKLLDLERVLHARVIGQDEAVKAVATAIRRSRAGMSEGGRPTGSFIFAGPTGVGKTELSKALAEAVFGDEDALIRIDMSEYMEKHSISKLIGSPPGYVGYEDEGQLTEKVRRKPYSIVLFDEIEKAHEDIFNVMLQVLDDGRLTDSKGRLVDFKNTIIIMTSNVGAAPQKEKARLGFLSGDESVFDYDRMRENILEGLRKKFRPEFLNRVDDVICFHRLTKEECYKIADILLGKISERLAGMKIGLQINSAAKKAVLDKGYNEEYGARPLKRTVEKEIADKISTEIIRGNLKEGDTVVVDYMNDEFVFFKTRG
ncbi:MAG: ATP-dependent Clp protease ATP-binding subunit [Clostridia bacterium]|nr:ATP-dependent Clp protease ATP-binding subunit [Clostridia bacterium]